MKKIALLVMGSIFLFGLSSFVWNTSNEVKILSNFYVSKPETLTNAEYGETISLYTDGKCVVQTSTAAAYGTYDLTYSGIIKINWNNGAYIEGTYVKTDHIKTIEVNGITYTNTKDLKSNANFYASKPETLTNESIGETVYLYTGGRCSAQTANGSLNGTYELTTSGIIKIVWEGEVYQEGTYLKITDVNNITRIKSIFLDGDQYTNKERFVVPRN